MVLWVAIILTMAILAAGIVCWACCAAGARADEKQRRACADIERERRADG